jgi:hypothetical protein
MLTRAAALVFGFAMPGRNRSEWDVARNPDAARKRCVKQAISSASVDPTRPAMGRDAPLPPAHNVCGLAVLRDAMIDLPLVN